MNVNLFDGMRAFAKVVEAGGFAAAARDLGLARSVVHKQVIKLEQSLGTQLLRRSTRQVSPTETGQAFGPRWVVNFPTKQHWRQSSQLHWIQDGLVDLRRFIAEQRVQSIAIPALGAGLGGLAWAEVRSAIETELTGLDGVQITVYEPLTTPVPAPYSPATQLHRAR